MVDFLRRADSFKTDSFKIQNENNAVYKGLVAELGKYPSTDKEHGVKDLGENGISALNKGIAEYQNKEKKSDPFRYRKQFIDLVVTLSLTEEKNYKPKEPDIRELHPEQATIQMDKLLGANGLRLYELALEEEMNSYEYREAVFNSSTTFIEGDAWEKPPVAIISGPSACGKSYTTKLLTDTFKDLPIKQETAGLKKGNLLVSKDGGVGRSESQVRKLGISLSNVKGYTGIEDLHKRSSYIEPMKDLVYDAGMAKGNKKDFGLILPETFSYWNPMPGVSSSDKTLLTQLAALEDKELLFFRIEGENPEDFFDLVCYMGSSRAWETKNLNEKASLSLNSTSLAESKGHGQNGFGFGVYGSENADKYLVNHRKASGKEYSAVIKNSLIRVRRNPESDTEDWIPVKKGEVSEMLVPRAVFEKWRESDKQMSLAQYSKANQTLDMTVSGDFEALLARGRLSKGFSIVLTSNNEAPVNSANSVENQVAESEVQGTDLPESQKDPNDSVSNSYKKYLIEIIEEEQLEDNDNANDNAEDNEAQENEENHPTLNG